MTTVQTRPPASVLHETEQEEHDRLRAQRERIAKIYGHAPKAPHPRRRRCSMADVAVAPTGVLDPNLLYFGDNGRCHCGRLACAGQQAFFTGRALDGDEVVSFRAIEAAAKRDATLALNITKFACETCGQKQCPDCGGPMEKCEGTISEEVMKTGTGETSRIARPAVYYACCCCEHCEEVR